MMEGYKKTLIGEIPSHWNVLELAEFTDEITDYVAAGSFASLRENVNVFTEPNHAIYVRLTDLRKGLGHLEQKYVDKESYDFLSKSNLYGRELLFANIGANVGEVWMMPELEKDATVAPNMIVIRANNENIVPEYLHAYLCSSIGLRQIDKIIAGSGHPKINKTELRKLSTILPPLPEQQKIADILSTVDAKIDIIDQQIAETQELKKGLMQRLLTKGIGHTEFKDSPLGEIPKSWEVVNVKEITKEHTQGFYTKNGYVENGIRLARITDLNNPKVDFSEMPMLNISDSDYESYKIEKGDFLFARSGAIGTYGIVENEEHPAVFASYLIRFRYNSNIVNRFFGYFFESFLCENQLKGITQGNANVNINAENIKSLKFPLAPFEEQEKIALIISSVDDKIEILKEKKQNQQELKKGLMQQLLTGKIRVV